MDYIVPPALYPKGMQLEIPPGDFRAYLFDCDGTVVDSMPLHYIAWKTALAEWGCDYPEDLFYQWGGKPIRQIIADLNAMQGLNMPVEQVAHRKEGLYYELLPKLTAVPEVLEQIKAQHGRIPFAIVSGSTRESVVKSLEVTHLLDKFDVLVCAGEYERPKPAPDPFLLAARKLNVPPEQCLVFEDTDLGIDAATAAGMQSIRILQPWERVQTEATARG
jgi:HAD superfamily hydrolase (TIGR01509 family)